MHVLSVSSLKGGVGKTTVTLGLASAAFARGVRTLVVDLDPQSDVSTGMDIQVAGKLKELKVKAASVLLDINGLTVTPEFAAEFALGLRLRTYAFDKYKTAKKDDDAPESLAVTIVVDGAGKARKAWADAEAVAEGVELARNLVNEAPNHLGPSDFADEAKNLEKLGVDVEILDEKDMKKLGMGALLAVGKGSVRAPRLAVLKWKGVDVDQAPI